MTEELKNIIKKGLLFLGASGCIAILSGAAWFGGYTKALQNESENTKNQISNISTRITEVEKEQREYREKVLVYIAKTDEKLNTIIKKLE